MDNITDVIEALGGSAKLAEALGVDSAKVRMWKHRGNIPPDFWIPIANVAKSKRVKGIHLKSLMNLKFPT